MQEFATASGSQCNIEKSRLISLSEADFIDYAGWTGEFIKRANTVRYLGIPMGVGTYPKQAFDWMMERIRRKSVGNTHCYLFIGGLW